VGDISSASPDFDGPPANVTFESAAAPLPQSLQPAGFSLKYMYFPKLPLPLWLPNFPDNCFSSSDHQLLEPFLETLAPNAWPPVFALPPLDPLEGLPPFPKRRWAETKEKRTIMTKTLEMNSMLPALQGAPEVQQ